MVRMMTWCDQMFEPADIIRKKLKRKCPNLAKNEYGKIGTNIIGRCTEIKKVDQKSHFGK
jgi:hypothetical protein